MLVRGCRLAGVQPVGDLPLDDERDRGRACAFLDVLRPPAQHLAVGAPARAFGDRRQVPTLAKQLRAQGVEVGRAEGPGHEGPPIPHRLHHPRAEVAVSYL